MQFPPDILVFQIVLLFNLSLLIIDIVQVSNPLRFTCLCFSAMKSCLLYSIVGLAWLIVSHELLALMVALTVLVVGKIKIGLLKHIIKMRTMKIMKFIVQTYFVLQQILFV